MEAVLNGHSTCCCGKENLHGMQRKSTSEVFSMRENEGMSCSYLELSDSLFNLQNVLF